MEQSPSQRDVDLEVGLLDHFGTSVDMLRAEFGGTDLDCGVFRLLWVASSLEDRFSLAMRLIPTETLIRLACDFAQSALESTADLRKYSWEVSEGKRNEESLRTLRQCIDGKHPDADTIIASWSQGCCYVPILSPGLHGIARAMANPEDAAPHCLKAAKEARRYYAWRITPYPHHERECRKAEQNELRWQMEHSRIVVQLDNLGTLIE